MDAPVLHPTLGRVCLVGTPDARRGDIIDAVADLFVGMGSASRGAEVHRLATDSTFFDTWVLELPSWCPQVAFYEGDAVGGA